MNAPRRKLLAIDDPLATPVPAAPGPVAGRPGDERSVTAALYVRLPIAESEALARAAFELRTHKRLIVAALIATHVDVTSDDARRALTMTIEEYRQLCR
jgi:hypothetical protein